MTGPKKYAFLAKLLPVVGLILILPPLVSIRNVDAQFFGFPAIIAYLFGVWLLLIVGAFLLQIKLPAKPSDPDEKSLKNQLVSRDGSNGRD